MSKTKRALPEDFSVLTGDELDGSPDEPDITDVAINDIHRAVTTLEQYQHVAGVFRDELAIEFNRIKKILVAAGKRPF